MEAEMTSMIREARQRHRLTIYELAARLDITPGAVSHLEKSERAGTIKIVTLRRALEVMGEDLQLTAKPSPMKSKSLMSARTAAVAINHELRAGDNDAALRLAIQAIDHFRQAQTSCEIADFLHKPAPIEDIRWDTLLATAIRWDATRRGIDAPGWTKRPPLPCDWIPGVNTNPSEEFADVIRQQAEPDFLEHRILMRARDFDTR
jgi:transcriptional regulator with XRE-family HTH domain